MKKKQILLILLLTLSLTTYAQTEKENSSDDNELSEAEAKYNAIRKIAEKKQKEEKRLSKLERVSKKTLRTAIPGSLIGISHSKVSVHYKSSMFGKTSFCEVTYENEEEHYVKLKITDGAGKTGSMVVSAALASMNPNSRKLTQDDAPDIIVLGNRKAIAKQSNHNIVQSSLSFPVHNRYWVVLSGYGFDLKALKKAYQELDFSKLP